MRRRRFLALGLVALVAAGAAFFVLRNPSNVSHPNLEFTSPSASTGPPVKPAPDLFQWPRYGFDAARTRYLPDSTALDPPFHRGWTFHGSALLEFPPVIAHDRLYFLDDGGVAIAVDSRTGRVLWRSHVGTLAAASPAVAGPLLLMPLLSTRPNPGQNPGGGRFVAILRHNGHVVWSIPVAPGTESSPLVWNSIVYFGDQNGVVRALRVSDGHQVWSYQASGAVKGGVSLAGSILYFGDYAGRAYALNSATGRPVWAVGAAGALSGGNFYSTAAVAFGRVYMGSTDGRVYSFAAHSGQLAWATGTGAYVYASPAVADIPGLGPTVYIGSYDGSFYAFDARSGRIRWRHPVGGRISGSATIVGDVVYFSDLGSKTTTGLNVRTGRTVFRFPEGAFTPVVANHYAVYLVGYADMFQLLPQGTKVTTPATNP